jgi:hypothetical protein
MSFENVTLMYQHPHISIYLEDNTIYNEDNTSKSVLKDFNGIQVGFFDSGRDNVLLYCSNATEFLNEYGNPNYELFGQAGYNAHNALSTNYCGMYVMRLMPDNATFANTVVMAKFKLIDDPNVATVVKGNQYMELSGVNPIKQLIPSTTDPNVLTMTGKLLSGLTTDSAINGAFSHITTDWLNGTTTPKFTILTVKIPVPTGVVVADNVTITQTSKALKAFYSDFNMDPTNVVADANGTTATKTKSYDAASLLNGATSFELSMLVAENDTISLAINWGSVVESFTLSASGLTFVATAADLIEVVPKKFAIAYEAKSIADVSTTDELDVALADLYSEALDSEGYYNLPLFAVWQLGRGTYGNNTRIKFADANEYDGATDPTVRTYYLSVMEPSTTGLTVKEKIFGMFDQNAYDEDFEEGPSLFMEELINDPDNGSGKIGMKFNSITFKKMLDVYNTIVDAGDEKNIKTLDVITGKNVDGTTDEYIEFVNNAASAYYVNLISTDGFKLANGTNGSFEVGVNNDATAVATAKTKALIAAFDGSTDRKIKSRYSTPADFVLDANFPDDVKKQMVAFAIKREYDCMTYLDTGLLKTSNEIITWLKKMNNVYAYNVLKEMHCYEYRDRSFTGKKVPMTITHWLAKALPTHIGLFGIGEPFAREAARIVNKTDFVTGTFFPVIDPDDHDIKKEIYKYGANCFETVRFNTFQRSSANTTCKENSDRQEEYNEYIVNKAVTIAHSLLSSKLYKIAEPDDRIRFQEHAQQEVTYQLSKYVRTCSVIFKMSPADEKKKILRIALRLTFKTTTKYGIVEIYLDPRVADAAA